MVDLYQQAVELHRAGRTGEAEAIYRELVSLDGNRAHAHYLLGNILLDSQRLGEARRHFIQAVKADSRNPHYHTALGLAFERMDDAEMAESSFRMAASLDSSYTECHLQLGRLLCRKGDIEASADCYAGVLAKEPANPRALLAYIALLPRIERIEQALELVDAAELAGLDRLTVLRARCSVHEHAKDHSKALAAATEWMEADPSEIDAVLIAGIALGGLNRLEEGLRLLLRAYGMNPRHVDCLINLGHILHKQERFVEALRMYELAVFHDPARLPALHGLTFCHYKLGGKKWPDSLRQAARFAREMLRRDASTSAPYMALGSVLLKQLQMREGLHCFRKAVELDPAAHSTHSSMLFHGNYYHEMSREEQFQMHLEGGRILRKLMGPEWKHFPQSRDPERPLRLGFVSYDLKFHPVAYFLLPVIQGLAPHFEVYIYSALPTGEEDKFTQRFAEASTFTRINQVDDAEAARIIRADGIDVLFDLSGRTTGHRLGVFSCRAAPVQVSWLGYPNTTGLDTMDFRLSDAIVEPEGDADAFSSERIIRLPGGFHTYVPFYEFPAVSPLPALTAGQVTLGCFNNMRKVTPHVISLWARVLKALPTARIILKDRTLDHPENRLRMHSLFASYGVNSRRVLMSGMIDSNAAHLALYSQVDIALDSFPYNGTTTTCEALYMGCPVVSLMGDRHAARVTPSLLTHAGHPEWIAYSDDDYVRLVARLGSDPAALAAIRSRLREDVASSSLCDTARFVNDMAGAIRQMWREYCAGRAGVQETHGVLEHATNTP